MSFVRQKQGGHEYMTLLKLGQAFRFDEVPGDHPLLYAQGGFRADLPGPNPPDLVLGDRELRRVREASGENAIGATLPNRANGPAR